MNELLNKIALELKALGLREFGAPVWGKVDGPALHTAVTADVKTVVVNGSTLSSLQLPLSEGGFVSVRLGKGVPSNKTAYDIHLYTALRDWTPDPGQRGTPIKKGARTAMAH